MLITECRKKSREQVVELARAAGLPDLTLGKMDLCRALKGLSRRKSPKRKRSKSSHKHKSKHKKSKSPKRKHSKSKHKKHKSKHKKSKSPKRKHSPKRSKRGGAVARLPLRLQAEMAIQRMKGKYSPIKRKLSPKVAALASAYNTLGDKIARSFPTQKSPAASSLYKDPFPFDRGTKSKSDEKKIDEAKLNPVEKMAYGGNIFGAHDMLEKIQRERAQNVIKKLGKKAFHNPGLEVLPDVHPEGEPDEKLFAAGRAELEARRKARAIADPYANLAPKQGAPARRVNLMRFARGS